eukprot:1040793-Amphidinium_carterae.1
MVFTMSTISHLGEDGECIFHGGRHSQMSFVVFGYFLASYEGAIKVNFYLEGINSVITLLGRDISRAYRCSTIQ